MGSVDSRSSSSWEWSLQCWSFSLSEVPDRRITDAQLPPTIQFGQVSTSATMRSSPGTGTLSPNRTSSGDVKRAGRPPRHETRDTKACRTTVVDMHRLSVAAGVVLSLVLLAGCGTSKRATSTTVPPPSVSRTTQPPVGGSRTTVTPSTGPITTPTTTPLKISGFLAQSVSFVTADDGFVIGLVACPNGICLALRHTVDRGRSWTSLAPPPTPLGQANNAGIDEMHFADAVDGWAYGDTFWVTHDGAQHWHQVNLGGIVVAMASGAGEAYALVGPCASTSPCSGSEHLFRSPVGQDSWTQVPGVSGRFDQGQYSLVVEGRTVFLLSAFPSPQLLTSSDGIHFSSLAVPCSPASADQPQALVPGSLAASDPSDLAVACLGGVAAGSEMKQVLISHDGGQTFQTLPAPQMAGDGAKLAMPTPATLFLATASAATFVFRIAPPDSVWTTALFFADGGAGLSDVAFVDPSHGALIHGPAAFARSILGLPNPPPGLGEVYLTDGGGSAWYPIVIPS